MCNIVMMWHECLSFKKFVKWYTLRRDLFVGVTSCGAWLISLQILSKQKHDTKWFKKWHSSRRDLIVGVPSCVVWTIFLQILSDKRMSWHYKTELAFVATRLVCRCDIKWGMSFHCRSWATKLNNEIKNTMEYIKTRLVSRRDMMCDMTHFIADPELPKKCTKIK